MRSRLLPHFGAIRCDIYTDVDGIYTADPRIVSSARKLSRISFEEMLELASLGANVLQTRSVELAMQRKIPLRVLSSYEDVGPDSGTIVCDEEEIMERNVVNGIALFSGRGKADFGLRRRSTRNRSRRVRFAGRSRGQRGHDRAEHLGRGTYRHHVFLPRSIRCTMPKGRSRA